MTKAVQPLLAHLFCINSEIEQARKDTMSSLYDNRYKSAVSTITLAFFIVLSSILLSVLSDSKLIDQNWKTIGAVFKRKLSNSGFASKTTIHALLVSLLGQLVLQRKWFTAKVTKIIADIDRIDGNTNTVKYTEVRPENQCKVISLCLLF